MPTQETQRHGFSPWGGKISWRRAWQPTPEFLPEEFHGQRSLTGYIQSMGSQRVRQGWAAHTSASLNSSSGWLPISTSFSCSCGVLSCSLPGMSLFSCLNFSHSCWLCYSIQKCMEFFLFGWHKGLGGLHLLWILLQLLSLQLLPVLSFTAPQVAEIFTAC